MTICRRGIIFLWDIDTCFYLITKKQIKSNRNETPSYFIDPIRNQKESKMYCVLFTKVSIPVL